VAALRGDGERRSDGVQQCDNQMADSETRDVEYCESRQSAAPFSQLHDIRRRRPSGPKPPPASEEMTRSTLLLYFSIPFVFFSLAVRKRRLA
jgi:hypothetical protein